MTNPLLPHKYPTMTVQEFIYDGYLQELNRLFLHPLGLALSYVENTDTGKVTFGPIFDGRENADGFYFDELTQADEERGLAHPC